MRFLCSHLVTLTVQGAETRVNLEEIWPEGSMLEAERSFREGPAELRCDGVLLAGRILRSDRHEFGWRIQMDFSPLTPWSLALFEPQHLLAIESP